MALPTLDLFRGEAPSSISSSFCWAWAADVRELVAALFRFRLSVCLWMQGSQLCQWNNYKILFSFNAVKYWTCSVLYVGCQVPWLNAEDERPTVYLACPRLQARSATARGGNWSRNASRNGSWDRYWGHTSQLLANFFSLSLPKVPEVFAKINSAQFPSVARRRPGSGRFRKI